MSVQGFVEQDRGKYAQTENDVTTASRVAQESRPQRDSVHEGVENQPKHHAAPADAGRRVLMRVARMLSHAVVIGECR